MAEVLVNGNEQDSKIVALNLVMKNNLLFSEFVKEVYLVKSQSTEKAITKEDVENFFERKKHESAIVALWKPYVFKKLGQVYINILFKAGVVNRVFDRKRVCIELKRFIKV